MPNSVPEIYRTLIAAQSAAAEQCFADTDALASFTRSHNVLTDLESLLAVVSGRPESVCLESSVDEYQYGLAALISGHYRHAFGSLRLSFELLLATIYFSGHEVKLNQWILGGRDLTWTSLLDENKGVFSADFVGAFSETLSSIRKQFSGLASSVYRECSEFVHGNLSAHEAVAGDIKFRKDMVILFEEKAQSIKLCFVYAFLFRYLPKSPEHAKTIMEPIAMDALGHEESVRELFQESAA